MLFSDEFLDTAVNKTNLYASRNLRLRNWVPVTKEEMKAYLGILILMGITRKPSVRHYWHKKIGENCIFFYLRNQQFFMLVNLKIKVQYSNFHVFMIILQVILR